MKRFFKIAGIVVVSIVVILALIVSFRFKDVIFVEKKTPEELASILTPHFIIKHPSGDGPFPTVLMFHGADGIWGPSGTMLIYLESWRDYFVGLGYATILVDSFTGRGITTPDDIEIVSALRKLWGSERAGDVLVAINESRKLTFVDSNRLVLWGTSHGGWAVMSLLALDLSNELPPNLISSPKSPLNGVKCAIGLVPVYPTMMMHADGDNWNKSIKMYAIFGGKDKYLDGTLKSIKILLEKNNPISYHIYPSAGHVFELAPENKKYYPDVVLPDLSVPEDARRRAKEFLEEIFK